MEATSDIGVLAGLLDFARYFLAGSGLVVFFCVIYGFVTPYPELQLVKEGKVAPAISFGGALVGFVLPLASAVSNSIGFGDMLIWALVALVVQLLVFLVLRLVFRDLVHRIADNDLAAAVLLAFCAIAFGILNAACLTY